MPNSIYMDMETNTLSYKRLLEYVMMVHTVIVILSPELFITLRLLGIVKTQHDILITFGLFIISLVLIVFPLGKDD